MTFKKAFRAIEQIPGWMGIEDCQALWSAVKNSTGLIVEIGPFMGRSTLIMAQAAPKARIISIDPFQSVHGSIPNITPKTAKSGFLRNVKNYNVTLIEDTSQNVGLKWNKKIDFLHIDGDHTYWSVLNDIKLFGPHVKHNCYVYIHDYVVLGAPYQIIAQKNNKLSSYYDKEYGIVRALNELGSCYFQSIQIHSGFAKCKKR